jgi:hypothetical protein
MLCLQLLEIPFHKVPILTSRDDLDNINVPLELARYYDFYTDRIKALSKTNNLIMEDEDLIQDKDVLEAFVENQVVISKFFSYVDFIKEKILSLSKEDLIKMDKKIDKCREDYHSN